MASFYAGPSITMALKVELVGHLDLMSADNDSRYIEYHDIDF